jgi:hypothetical protein
MAKVLDSRQRFLKGFFEKALRTANQVRVTGSNLMYRIVFIYFRRIFVLLPRRIVGKKLRVRARLYCESDRRLSCYKSHERYIQAGFDLDQTQNVGDWGKG